MSYFDSDDEEVEEIPVVKEVSDDPRKGLPANVIVEEAPAPMSLQTANPLATGPWIKYKGVATVRILTQKDWAAVGVNSSTYAEWNYLNEKKLPRSMFSDEELQYLLRVDGRFELVDD